MRADRDPSPSIADDLVVVPRVELDDMRARLEALERAAAPPAAPAAPPAAGTVGRRRALLGLAGIAAAGAGAVAATATPAAAADGDHVVLGSLSNASTASTGIAVSGTARTFGFGVVDSPVPFIANPPAILGRASNGRFAHAVMGLSTGTASAIVAESRGTGLALSATSISGRAAQFTTGSSTGGTSCVTATAFSGNPTNGNIALLAGGDTQLRLSPNSRPTPPTSSEAGTVGQLRWTEPTAGVSGLWACIATGTPGTWRKVTGLGTAGAFHLFATPVRVYDSRPSTAPAQGPKIPLPAGNVARTIDLKVNGSTVPAGATGVVLTVLLANAAAGPGNLTVWAADQPKPLSNTIIWGGSAGRFTTLAMSAVDAQARVKVDASLSTNLILDVVGYFR